MAFAGAVFGGRRDRGTDVPLQLSLATDEPRKLLVGRTATSGVLGFQGLERGDSRQLHMAIILAGHRCRAVPRVWANGELLGQRNLQHGVRHEIPEFRDGSRHRFWLTWYDGREGQTANQHVINAQTTPVRLRSTDRFEGMSYVFVEARYDTDSLTSVPELIFEVEGASFYDRREDSTAGGSGPQRWDEPSTWQFTRNPAVVADHYQLGMVGGAARDRLIFGMGKPSWQVPFEEFRENADLNDEGGRYQVNGILSAGADHRDNITALAHAMAAQPYDTGGRVIIRPAQVRPVIMTLRDSDLVDSASYDLDLTPSGTDLVNTVVGTYREPNVRHNEIDYPPITDEFALARDGREFETTRNLDLVTSVSQAQRIARIELERHLRRDRLKETYMPIANRLEVGDWFERASTLRGSSVKIFEVENKRVRSDLTVEIEARETDPNIVAFGADQEIPVAPLVPLPPVERSAGPELTMVAQPTSLGGGGVRVPAVSLTIELDGLDEVDFIEIEYGRSNGLTGEARAVLGSRELSRYEFTGQTMFEITDLVPGAPYLYRSRTVSDRIVGPWSDYQEFTADSRLIASDTNMVAGRPASTIFDGFEARFTDAEAELQGLIDTFGSTESAAASAAQAAEILAQTQFVGDEVTSSAIAVAEQTVVATEQAAAATATTQLTANARDAAFAANRRAIINPFEIENGLPSWRPFRNSVGDENTPAIRGQAVGNAWRITSSGGFQDLYTKTRFPVRPESYFRWTFRFNQEGLNGGASGHFINFNGLTSSLTDAPPPTHTNEVGSRFIQVLSAGRHEVSGVVKITNPSPQTAFFRGLLRIHFSNPRAGNICDIEHFEIEDATSEFITQNQVSDIRADVEQNSQVLATTETQLASLSSVVSAGQAQSTITQQALNDVEGYLQSRATIESSAGGALSRISTRSISTGNITSSDITLEADQLVFEAGGARILSADTQGLTMNYPIRFIGGPVGNPNVLYVIGNGFGANNDLMEWYGPYHATNDTLRTDNGTRAKDIEGFSYLNGVREGGDPINSSETITLLGTVTLSSLNANGNITMATMSCSVQGSGRTSSSPVTTPQSSTQTRGSARMRLFRREGSGPFVEVRSETITGVLTITRNTGGTFERFEMGMSFEHSQRSNRAFSYDYRVVVDQVSGLPTAYGLGRSTTVAVFEPPV